MTDQDSEKVVYVDYDQLRQREDDLIYSRKYIAELEAENSELRKRVAELEEQISADKIPCVWTEQGGFEYWETSCDNAFVLTDGTPKDNDMHFCPYCGHPLVEYTPKSFTDEEDEETT